MHNNHQKKKASSADDEHENNCHFVMNTQSLLLHVEIRPSTIEGAGLGLFALEDFEIGQKDRAIRRRINQ